MESTDRRLVADALGGDREAFSVLVRRHQDAVYSVCYHFLGPGDEAQDAAQEAFVRAYTTLRNLRKPNAFGSWLRGIAAHVALDLARQRQRLLARPDIDSSEIGAAPTVGMDPEASAVAGETLRQIQGAIRSLPETYRMAALFRFGMEMKYTEIAQALGITEGAVEVRLVRARRMLREKLAAQMKSAPEGAV